MVALYMVQFSGEEEPCSKYAKDWLKLSAIKLIKNML